MTVDIYIKEKSGKREIRIPVLPDKISYKSGETEFVSYDIMHRGEVAVPSGVGLSTVSWASEFPGKLQKNNPMLRGSWKAPKTYHSILEDWKKDGTELNLMVTGYPINFDVYLKEYNAEPYGAFGDMAYEVGFIESRDITIKTSKVQKKTEKKTTKRTTKKSTTYTIKSGDTLWGISLKFYGTGTKWKTIYNANKTIIEKTAKKYGRSSSSNGHWIYPGVKLTIPDASKTTTTKKTTTKKTTTNDDNRCMLYIVNSGPSSYWGTYTLSVNGAVFRTGKAANYSVRVTSGNNIRIYIAAAKGHTYDISDVNFKITKNKTVYITWME